MGKEGYLPLFETKGARGRSLYWLYVVSVFIGICLICGYRVIHAPAQGEIGKHAWVGLFMAELWFTLYWLVAQSLRWNPTFRYTFKDRLSERYESILPGLDIFVCTADAVLEPPIMVVNTVLSVMAYDYPPEKLNIYLSDDGGSELTFYALLEASRFSNYWLPFCRKFKIEPSSPSAYFSIAVEPLDNSPIAKQWSSIKKRYEEMKQRIENSTKLGHISEELRRDHKGFREWDDVSNKRDHQAIIQILIDGRDTTKAVDINGQPLPTLVYIAREKRPQYHHNYKAGSMNALIRVSSRISNSPIILNVDCDMYSNTSESVRDAMCFFMDEENSDQIAFVQFPQKFNNLTKNDIYSNCMRVMAEVEMPCQDSNGGSLYIGSACFHRRDTLCGKVYNKESHIDWTKVNYEKGKEEVDMLEEACKVLASCCYEQNTQWGKEIGIMYGCPVEDAITGLAIKCRGWKSIYFNPEKRGFFGVSPTTLLQVLVQHKRWSEGDLQILLSKYCPLLFGHGRIPLKLQISYFVYLLWAPNWLPTLFYVVIPSLCFLRGISLFPKFSSPWILPFAFVIIATNTYSLGEFFWCGSTFKGWWNDQRMWLYKRLTSYFFGFFDTMLKIMGFTNSGFAITAKVAEDDVSKRYEEEIIEFGATSPMFNILSAVALVNLFSFSAGVKRLTMDSKTETLDLFALQIVLSGLVVFINLPLYQGLFLRKDKGRMPSSVTYQSIAVATFSCLVALYY